MRVLAATGKLPPVMARSEHVSLRDPEELKQSRSSEERRMSGIASA
jgi:hypothetical protein